MRIIKFAVFSLVVLTSCQSFWPSLPRKYAREFLQSKKYPAGIDMTNLNPEPQKPGE